MAGPKNKAQKLPTAAARPGDDTVHTHITGGGAAPALSFGDGESGVSSEGSGGGVGNDDSPGGVPSDSGGGVGS
jgi:hypothetical protein